MRARYLFNDIQNCFVIFLWQMLFYGWKLWTLTMDVNRIRYLQIMVKWVFDDTKNDIIVTI